MYGPNIIRVSDGVIKSIASQFKKAEGEPMDLISIPSVKIEYWLTIDETTEDEQEITKEEVIHDIFSLSKIPVKGDYIRFGDEECLFEVKFVTRSQNKNVITISGNHIGHDGGIVYRKMVENHGFHHFGIKEEPKRKGTGRFEYTCKVCGWKVSTNVLPSNGICPDCR
jgi:hypothetical protein